MGHSLQRLPSSAAGVLHVSALPRQPPADVAHGSQLRAVCRGGGARGECCLLSADALPHTPRAGGHSARRGSAARGNVLQLCLRDARRDGSRPLRAVDDGAAHHHLCLRTTAAAGPSAVESRDGGDVCGDSRHIAQQRHKDFPRRTLHFGPPLLRLALPPAGCCAALGTDVGLRTMGIPPLCVAQGDGSQGSKGKSPPPPKGREDCSTDHL